MRNMTKNNSFKGLSCPRQPIQKASLILLALLVALPLLQAQGGAAMPTDDKTELLRANAQILRFEQNIGQFPEAQVLYRSTDAQATYFFTKNEIRSVVASAKDSMQTAYALQFVGANEAVDIRGIGRPRPEHGAINYMTAAGSFGDVPTHNRLHYTNLWDGVNAYFYESREGKGTMKYDFIVQPKADPSVIKLKMDGVKNLKINAQGELEFTTPFGTLQKGKPYTYQMVDGKQVEVASEYTLTEEGEIGFKIGTYNAALPLVIDPIALKWSTYLMAGILEVSDIYVHPTTGRIYLVGSTNSAAFPNTLGRPYGGGTDAFVTCMEKDGTTLVWSTYLGGAATDEAYAVSVDAAGDVYVVGYTSSTDFPVNGTTAAYDATFNGNGDIFVARLNSTGATLKYSSYVGGSASDASSTFRKSIVSNGKVYIGANSNSTDFPTTPGAYQASRSGISAVAVLFCLNTNVGGAAGLEMSTYFNGLQGVSSGNYSDFNEIEEDKDGNLWLVGNAKFDASFPISANAVQKYADFSYTGSTTANFVAKFSKSGQYLYSSWVHPLWSPSNVGNSWSTQFAPSLDVDAAGNVYIGAATFIVDATASTVKKAPNILAFHELSPLNKLEYFTYMSLGYLAKIPYDLAPQYDFVSVFPSNAADNYADPEVAVDKKGNIHLLTHGGDYDWDFYHPLTPGAVNTVIGINASPSVYYVLPPSGNSVLYGTVLNSAFSYTIWGMFVNDDCEAYLISQGTKWIGSNYPITPSYRDFETNTQKTVYNSTVNSGWALSVFHEPRPNNNTIPNFAVGNNTFCVGGAIWQNPNDGPILGSTPTYTSGNGSASSHNLPNISYDGASPVAHPTPVSPAIAYQWQKRVNGGAWTDVANGTYAVYKPSPEPAAGTVEYRRRIISSCDGSANSTSNIASATIAGTFNLQVNTPSKPVYYCPTVAGTSLGITITGASGNISWQWYDGYAPLSGTGIISPSSGSGVAQGSFTANVGTSVTGSGFYRLVVTDAGGCKKEAFVAIAPKTADAGNAASLALCPGGSNRVTLGPSAVNPDFDYAWQGPSGYTSILPNPTVSATGTYFLWVKLKTEGPYCNTPTSVTVTGATPHDAALVNIPNKGFCQSEAPASIGLSGTPPAGYVFQWVPGTNLDNQQAYNPVFDPGNVAGGFPIGRINFTFSALRVADGCIFEDVVTVTDTARALAQAGIDMPSCGTNPSAILGAVETQGSYFQWRAVTTTYPGGLAALTSHAKFRMDGVATNLGSNKFLTAQIPDHTACYTVDYEIIGSHVPFANGCYTRDTVRLFYCPTCGGDWCSNLTSNSQGTNGACSGAENWIGGESLGSLTYTWETESVNGVVQSGSNRQPRGLFYLNADGTKGAQLPITGAHPSKAIADFDNGAWGWPGANVVIYRLKANGNFGDGMIDCHKDIQVFSANNGVPAIGVIDQSLCVIASPGIRLGTTGQAAPYTLNGTDYTQAPNSAFNWFWTNVDGTAATTITSGATTRFPTFSPSATTQYLVTARDPGTGCFAKDTLTIKIKQVIADAGFNLTDICPGSLVQLGTSAVQGHTYSWSPSGGLNFPIGTPNSTTARPYLSVPSVPAPPATLTYTVTVTDSETGCQATDDMTIGTSTTAPPALTAASYNACPSSSFILGNYVNVGGATFQWTVVSGGNLSWLSSTSVMRPTVTLPSGFTGPAVFRLTLTKGTCGSVSANYTINNSNPAMTGGTVTASCASPYTQIGETALSGYSYSWFPLTALYTNSTLTNPYYGNNTARPYALPSATTTYTVTRTNTATGCTRTATWTVNPPTGVAVNAGADKNYCTGGSSITIGQSASATRSWQAIGYSADPYGAAPTSIATPMTSATMLGYIGGSSNVATKTFPASGTPLVGQYVYRVISTSGGCSISDDVVVTVPNIASGIAGLPQNVCPGESVQLGSATAPSFGIYSWTAINPSTENGTIDDPTAKRPNVNPSVNTTYQVIYTDGGSGCSVTETVPVVVNPKPNVADVSTAIACAPLSAQNLTTLVSGYGSLVSPVWYKTQYPGGTVVSTPTSVTPTATTDYFLLSQNTYGCYDTAQVTINVANPQTPNIIPSIQVPCGTTSVDLANSQGTPSQAGYTFEWHNANNTLAGTLMSSTVVSTAGTYYLFEKAPSPSNCYSASDNIVVTFQKPDPGAISGNQTVCSGGNPVAFTSTTAATGSGTISYQWQSSTTSTTAGFSNISGATGATYSAPTVTVTTYYRRVATSTLSGVSCTANSNALTVTVNSLPSASAGANVAICAGASTTLTASGGTSYAWSNGLGSGATKTVTPSSTTAYTVTVTNAAGCTATSTVTVNVGVCPEICDNGLDDDGDGLIDCADGDCPSCTTFNCSDGVKVVSQISATATGAGASGTPSISNFTVPAGQNRVVFVIASFEREHCGSTDNCTDTNTTGAGLGDNFASPNIISSGNQPQITARFSGPGGTLNKQNALAMPAGDLRFMVQFAFPTPPGTLAAAFYSRESYFIAIYESELQSLLGGAASGNINILLPDVVAPKDNADDAILLAYTLVNVAQNAAGVVRSGLNLNGLFIHSSSGSTPGNFTINIPDLDNGQEPNEPTDGLLIFGVSGLGGPTSTGGFLTTAGFTELNDINTSGSSGDFTTFNEPDGFSVSAQFRNGPSTGIINAVSMQSAASSGITSNGGMMAAFTFQSASCPEICDNGIDDDGDGFVDCADPDCSNGLAVSASASAASICTGGSTNLTATGSGGGGSYTYAWSNSLGTGAAKTVTPAATTTYTVTVTNATGCTATGQVTVTVNSLPSASAGANVAICAGASTTLTTSGGASYVWSNGLGSGATKTVTPASTTTYTVTVTNAAGCTATSTVTVTVNSLPSASAGANVAICAGASTTLTASGGTSYAWSNGLGSGATKTVTPASTTTYTVTVTNAAGCTATSTVTVNVGVCAEVCDNGIDDDGDGLIDCADPDCASSFTVNTTATSPAICRGENTTISASASGGTGPYTYAWNNGLGNGVSQNISPLATTAYTVTVTSAPGCTSTAQVTITVNFCAENCTDGIDNDGDGLIDCDDPDCGLSIAASPTSATCGSNNGQVAISASGGSGSYEYSKDSTTWVGSNLFSNITPGNHTFFIRNDDGACPISADATVADGCEACNDGIDNDGDGLVDCADTDCGPTSSAGSNISICMGTSAMLTATATGGTTPYTFVWDNGLAASETVSVSPSNTTTYTVTVTSATGCSSTSQATVAVTACPENCTDGIDNDGDGLVDCADPDCTAVAAPQLVDDAFVTCPGVAFQGIVSMNDGNLQGPVFTIPAPPTKGSVAINNWGGFTYTPSGSACGSDQFTYRVCNTGGCCATATASISIGDNVPPTLQNVPADLAISCDDEVPQAPAVFGLDACPGIYIEATETDDEGNTGACGTYTITRTWTTTDLCGNSASQSQNITVSDETEPEMFRVYTLPNGKKMVAGNAPRTSHLWKYVRFPVHFDAPPLVFAQVASNSDAAAVTVQTRYISTTGFEVRLREEEAADQLHGGETVSWMAMEAGNVDGSYTMAAQLLNNVNHNDQTLTYPLSFSSKPVFIGSVNGTVQADPVSVRTKAETASGLQLSLQEEQSADSETAHSNEKLAWLALSAGSDIYDENGGFVAEGGTVSTNHNWATVNLSHHFTKPVVLLGGVANNGSQAATIRVRNVTPTSFEVRVQEWDYLDGNHANEQLGYLVVEGSIPTYEEFYCFGGNPLQPGVDFIAIDNCDDQVALNSTETEDQLSVGLKAIRTWSASDDCGNVNILTRYDTCGVAAVRLKTLLSGALINAGTSGLMRDDLRTRQLIPTKEPYSGMGGYAHKGMGGGEVADDQVMLVPGAKAIVDWVFLECRSATDPANVLSTCSALLLRDGTVVTPTGGDVAYFWDLPAADYYVSVRHRNHLGLGTDSPWDLDSELPPMVDFTLISTPVQGSAVAGKLVNGSRAMWAGDFNGDGRAIYQGPYNDSFFLFSKVLSEPDNTGFLANYIAQGYNRADANLDGRSIYQGPNNDRSMLLLNTILAHPTNQLLLANFIGLQWLP